MSLGRRKMKLRTRRSPLTAFVVALSLIVQLFAGPFHQAMSAPAYSGADNAAIAADLKAVFGDAANLCAHIDGKGAPSPQPPCHHCDDQCTLCRFAAQAATYIPSNAPALARNAHRYPPLRSAPRPISAPSPPARPNATARGRRPSPSDDCSPRRSTKSARPPFFGPEVFMSTLHISTTVRAHSGASAIAASLALAFFVPPQPSPTPSSRKPRRPSAARSPRRAKSGSSSARASRRNSRRSV